MASEVGAVAAEDGKTQELIVIATQLLEMASSSNWISFYRKFIQALYFNYISNYRSLVRASVIHAYKSGS